MARVPPVASVVVPCRNGAAYLGGLLESLVADPLARDIEVIIADNGSTDGSADLALSFRDRLPGLRVVDASATVGRTAACNAGVAAASADVVLFLDSDDEIAPGYVGAMAGALATSDVAAAIIHGDRLNEPWVAATRQTGLQDDGLSHYLGFLPIAGGCAMGVRRDVFLELGGMHEVPFAEDVDFSWRAQLAGHSLTGVRDAVLQYRYRDSLWGIFTQALNYGAAQPLLHRLYGDAGLQRRRPRAVFRDVRTMLRQALQIRTKAQLGAWLFLAGILAGRARGSIRYRRVFL